MNILLSIIFLLLNELCLTNPAESALLRHFVGVEPPVLQVSGPHARQNQSHQLPAQVQSGPGSPLVDQLPPKVHHLHVFLPVVVRVCHTHTLFCHVVRVVVLGKVDDSFPGSEGRPEEGRDSSLRIRIIVLLVSQ